CRVPRSRRVGPAIRAMPEPTIDALPMSEAVNGLEASIRSEPLDDEERGGRCQPGYGERMLAPDAVEPIVERREIVGYGVDRRTPFRRGSSRSASLDESVVGDEERCAASSTALRPRRA